MKTDKNSFRVDGGRMWFTPGRCGRWARAMWCTALLVSWPWAGCLAADEATIRQDGTRWQLDTATMQRVVALEDGKLLLKSLKNKASGRELVPSGVASREFFAGVDRPEDVWSGASGDWQFKDSKVTTLQEGERQLDIRLQRDALEVTKSYVIYPGSSIVREWAAFKNTGTTPLRIFEPGFLSLSMRVGEPDALDFHWMTGGENAPGSWKLRTEKLSSTNSRKFDSYEPFPLDKTAASQFPGDGVRAMIRLNDKQVWPVSGWVTSLNATVTVPFDFRVDVKAGDKLMFVVNMRGNIGFDTTAFDPTIAYSDGETHVASKEFSNQQGQKGWRYQYIENGKFIDLVYYAGPNQWRKEKDNPTGTPFVGPGNQHPDNNQDAVRVWTVPRNGQVRITGSVCNTGNGGGAVAAGYAFRPGTTAYAPWYALYGKDTQEGVFIGWDYFGHWASAFSVGQGGAVTSELKVAGHKQTLAPGESLTTPKAFTGLFRQDLDNAGNECLDWQYRYLWDYTRDGWFPAIRMLGYWYKGTGWGQTGVGWTGGGPDFQSTFRKVFRVADLMRYVGADVYHRDWGWWDRAGDWNGPDFRTTIHYLAKSGMGQLIYAFLYTVDPQSKVARDHPDWVSGSTLDMSRPEVVEFMKGQLDGFVGRWGDFEWRNDSFFTAPRKGDDTPMLKQDEGFRKVIRDFLDRYPRCAFQAVNGGGNYGGYDYTRYASSFSFSDGAVGPLRNYYAALLFPPDKTSDIPDIWNPDQYNKATWRGLLCINFDMTGDTWDPVKLEGLRELVDIYHYLQNQGVVGRWVRVYRPQITGDDPTVYFQRLSRDGLRGIVIPKRPAPGPVTIRPKGLQPAESYLVSFHESDRSENRTGADLMGRGVQLQKMAAGELLYLNLPLHPGSKLDKEPPVPPSQANKSAGDNMGYPGVELSWKAGSDNNWVSYYEVFRDGLALDKVAKGTFYFDHSAGADLAARYELRTVDGAGNASAKVAVAGAAAKPATIIDDAVGGGLMFTGPWHHATNLLPAHAGTISWSAQKGAVAQFEFQGTSVLVFSKLGTNCGMVSVQIDNAPAETVDTYSADDIWGVCIYRKSVPSPGLHQLRLEVLGQHGARAKGDLIHLDGVRVEPRME